MEKLMNEENEWGHKISAEVKEGPEDCIRMTEVRSVLKKMKRHKAPGLSGLVAEMIQARGDIGTQWILDLCNDMQFGFMKGKRTIDAIFMARRMQQNFRVKGKELYLCFVDLKNAFDRLPREVISWAMCKLGVEKRLLSTVMSMYTGRKTVIRTVYGNSKGFEVKVCMHQGSALSPLLFVIVMEAISREFRIAVPWELLYADDLALIAETGGVD